MHWSLLLYAALVAVGTTVAMPHAAVIISAAVLSVAETWYVWMLHDSGSRDRLSIKTILDREDVPDFEEYHGYAIPTNFPSRAYHLRYFIAKVVILLVAAAVSVVLLW